MHVKYNASSTRRSTSTTTAWTWSALLTCEWRVAHRDTLSVKAPRARHANRIHPHPARIATRDATPAVGSGPASPSNPHPTNLDAFPSRFTSPLPHLVIFLLLPTPPPPDPANRETNHPRISLSLSLRRAPPPPLLLPPMASSSKRRGGAGGGGAEKKDLFHVVHKVPAGDSPYVRAKHLQVIALVLLLLCSCRFSLELFPLLDE